MYDGWAALERWRATRTHSFPTTSGVAGYMLQGVMLCFRDFFFCICRSATMEWIHQDPIRKNNLVSAFGRSNNAFESGLYSLKCYEQSELRPIKLMCVFERDERLKHIVMAMYRNDRCIKRRDATNLLPSYNSRCCLTITQTSTHGATWADAVGEQMFIWVFLERVALVERMIGYLGHEKAASRFLLIQGANLRQCLVCQWQRYNFFGEGPDERFLEHVLVELFLCDQLVAFNFKLCPVVSRTTPTISSADSLSLKTWPA